MKNKKIAILVLSAMIAGIGISATNANMFEISSEEKTEVRELFHKLKLGETLTEDEEKVLEEAKKNLVGIGGKMNNRKGVNGMMKGLTDDEKTALESMTDDEKKEFFNKKRAERHTEMEAKRAEREAHEAVIDKLIDGEELTDDEKVILEEIKEKRALRKAQRAEMEAKMEDVKIILEKVNAGEEITDAEQIILDEARGHGNGRKMGGRGGFGNR